MILTVTLNAALDITYETPGVSWGGSNRVGAVRRRAGGKGVNVSRVAAALGVPTIATGLLGGRTGDQVSRDLAALPAPGPRAEFVPIAGETRCTVTVVDPHTSQATVFNESGPQADPAEWTAFLDRYRILLGEATVVVLAGSLPPGLPMDAYAVLAGLAADAGVPAILDTDGAWLARGVAGRPAVVKPNVEELARATGERSPAAGARAIQGRGAGTVLVSLGAAGLLAITPEGAWRARPPEPVPGNPTGAGDAVVAAIAVGMVAGDPWPTMLRRAVALSAAAVRAPVAGEFDPAAFSHRLPRIEVTAYVPEAPGNSASRAPAVPKSPPDPAT